ncbi:MAG: hypothetical protein WCP01_02065 [Methylococcaceae bacterium]
MKLKRKRDVRGLVEKAIRIARMPPSITNTPTDDLMATCHLLETQAVSFKAAKIANFEVLHDISKRLTSLSNQLATR